MVRRPDMQVVHGATASTAASLGITPDAALHYLIGAVNAEAAAFTRTPPAGLKPSERR